MLICNVLFSFKIKKYFGKGFRVIVVIKKIKVGEKLCDEFWLKENIKLLWFIYIIFLLIDDCIMFFDYGWLLNYKFGFFLNVNLFFYNIVFFLNF